MGQKWSQMKGLRSQERSFGGWQAKGVIQPCPDPGCILQLLLCPAQTWCTGPCHHQAVTPVGLGRHCPPRAAHLPSDQQPPKPGPQRSLYSGLQSPCSTATPGPPLGSFPFLPAGPAVGAEAWARRAPQPAAPPRRPPQSASSPSASLRPPGAPATFLRPSPTPCSSPGPWQSLCGPGPPCAGCRWPTAGPGRRPLVAQAQDSRRARRGHVGTPPPSRPLQRRLDSDGPLRGGGLDSIHAGGTPFLLPLCVYT
ncbi:BLOC-1-related complex subunit 8 isoform X7 [Macaca fascicularis]|uniref:BLOC-1-related complex subunit 8 isoform X7 n=1 Tax=Macaca fascicularis TaxID=9541 RepID=UPI003D15A00E